MCVCQCDFEISKKELQESLVTFFFKILPIGKKKIKIFSDKKKSAWRFELNLKDQILVLGFAEWNTAFVVSFLTCDLKNSWGQEISIEQYVLISFGQLNAEVERGDKKPDSQEQYGNFTQYNID